MKRTTARLIVNIYHAVICGVWGGVGLAALIAHWQRGMVAWAVVSAVMLLLAIYTYCQNKAS